jgi:hypothetical protein
VITDIPVKLIKCPAGRFNNNNVITQNLGIDGIYLCPEKVD